MVLEMTGSIVFGEGWAPPDPVRDAVDAFVARTRTLTLHGRTEFRRRGLVIGETGSLDTMPDVGANGRYCDQSTSGLRPSVLHDGTRCVIRGLGDWMNIRESGGAASNLGNLWNATTGSTCFVARCNPVGNGQLNPFIGADAYHSYFNEGVGGTPSVGWLTAAGGGMGVASANGTLVWGIFRRSASSWKLITNAVSEVSVSTVDITANLASVAQLFRRSTDGAINPSIDLVFAHTEEATILDADVSPLMAHLETIAEE